MERQIANPKLTEKRLRKSNLPNGEPPASRSEL